MEAMVFIILQIFLNKAAQLESFSENYLPS